MANTVKDFASPNGPILLLSAKGSTTASIAEANGVKDFSGNGNHGKGNNGVTVEKYGGYDCFGFPNNNSYIYLSDKKDTIFTQISAYTFSVTFVITSKPTRSNGILVMWSYSSPQIQIWINRTECPSASHAGTAVPGGTVPDAGRRSSRIYPDPCRRTEQYPPGSA